MSKNIDTTIDPYKPEPNQFCDVMHAGDMRVFVGKTDKQIIQTDMSVSLEDWR